MIRWTRQQLASGWNQLVAVCHQHELADKAAEARRQRLRRTVARMTRRQLASGWNQLLSVCHEHDAHLRTVEAKRQLLKKTMARWTRQILASAFNQFVAVCHHERLCALQRAKGEWPSIFGFA